MNGFGNSVRDFLEGKGFHCEDATPEGIVSYRMLDVRSENGKTCRRIMLLNLCADTADKAQKHSEEAWKAISTIRSKGDGMPVIIAEDRWYSQAEMIRDRLLAHLEVFFPVYARNCEVRRIDKNTAAEFLSRTHSYADAACRYRYGLFLKRHTGHLAMETACIPGQLVAVATFSNARKWIKGEKTIRSYEWTRYASLPGIRVNGGMGKLLKAFIEEVRPDDIMSYADLEWSEGAVYEQLGFIREGHKSPVCFRIPTATWERSIDLTPSGADERFFMNYGSAKYRMKLTEYE